MTHLAPHRRLLLLAAPSFALTACSNIIGPPPSSQIYFLHAPAPQREAGEKVGWSLAIMKPNAPESLDSDRIALAKSDTKFDYYANAVWADYLPDLIQTRILAGFEGTDRIDVVSREEDGIHADFKLLTDIRDFEARYTNAETPPAVSVTVIAYIINAHSRKIVSTVTANSTQVCATDSVNAVVNAFDVSLAKVVERVVDWALNLPGPGQS